MNTAHPGPTVPRGALIGAAALLTFVIASAAIGHRLGAGRPEPTGAAITVQALRFSDTPDGSVNAQDPATGRLIGTIPPSQGSFARTALQGLDNLRRLYGIGPDAPFRLTTWRDGRVTLDDPATGVRMELEAFGPSNEQPFLNLLAPRRTPP